MLDCCPHDRPHIASLNIGRPQPLRLTDATTVPSGIRKCPAVGPLALSQTGLLGDEQADTKNHGGPDKAVCIYALEHYPRWSERLGVDLSPAAFGENFTTLGLVEYGVCIGDIYRIGGVVIEVSQPRQPCYKLGARHGCPDFTLWVQNSGLTGYYARCLEPGEVATGDTFTLLERPTSAVTIAEANRLMHRDRDDHPAIERILTVPALSASWRARFERRLAGITDDVSERIAGPAAR